MPSHPSATPGTGTARRPRRPRRRTTVRLASLAVLGAAPFLVACQPPAVTFTVDSILDVPDAAPGDGVCATAVGTCTLRAAVQEGNTNTDPGPVEVVLPAGVFVLDRDGAGEDAGATGDLDLTRAFLVHGAGSFGTTTGIDAANDDRAFDVHAGGRLTLRDLVVANGDAPSGGLIRAVGNVELTRVALTSASADTAGGLVSVDGGTLTATESMFLFGRAQVGGAIAADRVVLGRVTIANSAAVGGAAIALTDAAGSSTIDTATISGNTATGGAIVATAGGPLAVRDSAVNDNGSTTGALGGGSATSVGNSVLSDQTGGDDWVDPVTSLGGNLEAGTSCGLVGAGDRQGTPVTVTAYVNLGTTIAASFDHPAVVDQGTGCLATDQSGAARPADGDEDGVAECDRGPLERALLPASYTVTSAADDVDLDPGDGVCTTSIGACTLRAAVQESNARPTADTVQLSGGVTYVLSRAGAGEDAAATGDLDITDDLVVSVTGGQATIDANDIDRVIDVRAGTVSLSNLVITDGTENAGGAGVRTLAGTDVTITFSTVFNNTGKGGGGIRAAGTLLLQRSLVRGNGGGFTGGGLAVTSTGTATVSNSTFHSNNAADGSAISSLKGTVAVVDSTIASNTAGVAIEVDGTVSLRNSIVANNAAGNCSKAVTSLGHNLDSATSCGLNAAGDASSTAPALGTIANNGGPTFTMKPAAGSPAIGTGTCASTADQRGVSRPSGGACDKGAVEQ